jgi:hypothetical protein
VRITGIKINYTKLFDGIKSTDHKCMIIRRILAQKGMEGEPTVAKCKKMKRDLQAKRESAELDKSVIITDEGGFQLAINDLRDIKQFFYLVRSHKKITAKCATCKVQRKRRLYG